MGKKAFVKHVLFSLVL